MGSITKESFTLDLSVLNTVIKLYTYFLLLKFNYWFVFSRNSPAPAVTAASVTNIQATEVSVPQVNSSESSGGKEIGLINLQILTI
jgi:hypothetical protein